MQRASRTRPELPAVEPDHPLARAEAGVHRRRCQVTAVGAVLAVAGAGVLAGATQLLPVAVAAAAVLLALLVLLASATAARRDRAIEVIAGGRDLLPVDIVQRERARLADPRRANDLVRSLERLRREATSASRGATITPPLYVRATVRAAAADIARTVAALRESRPGPVAIARVERLLVAPGSPLYGADVRALREALHRIRFEARRR
jgi:hypothetical protein